MTYRTVEVEIEDGRVRPAGPDILPLKARGLLTLLENETNMNTNGPGLANWWSKRNRLSPEEAEDFAKDVEEARKSLPAVKSAWD